MDSKDKRKTTKSKVVGIATILGRYSSSTAKIDAYVIEGEVLNTTLSVMGQGANGNKHMLKSPLPEPSKVESFLQLLIDPSHIWSVENHYIEQVIKALDTTN